MIGFMSNIIASATASYQRIQVVLEAPEPPETGTITSNIKGDIRVNNVSLLYGEKPVLKNISFSVKAGSKTAIIGPTAAGKSQLLKPVHKSYFTLFRVNRIRRDQYGEVHQRFIS